MNPRELDRLSRSDLIERAESLGVDKASLLTRAELADEILRRTVDDPIERRVARGLLGIARDLVARIVERGLHLPDAAALIRGIARPSGSSSKPPIATVTLAEIYAAQGHRARALAVLDEVLAKEDDHVAARDLRDRIAASPPERDDSETEEAVAPPGDRTDLRAPGSSNGGESSGQAIPSNGASVDAPGPLERLEDAPLSQNDGVDEVALMPVDPKTVFVYWEVRRSTVDEARKRAENGRLVVRIVAVTASWDGPRVETRDIEVDQLLGDWFVRDLPPSAVLRAAIGWRAASLFEPLSVAMELAAPPEGPAAVEASGSSSWPAIGPSPWSGDLLATHVEVGG